MCFKWAKGNSQNICSTKVTSFGVWMMSHKFKTSIENVCPAILLTLASYVTINSACFCMHVRGYGSPSSTRIHIYGTRDIRFILITPEIHAELMKSPSISDVCISCCFNWGDFEKLGQKGEGSHMEFNHEKYNLGSWGEIIPCIITTAWALALLKISWVVADTKLHGSQWWVPIISKVNHPLECPRRSWVGDWGRAARDKESGYKTYKKEPEGADLI